MINNAKDAGANLNRINSQDNKVWPEEETSNQISIIDMDLKLFVESDEEDKLSIYMRYKDSEV